MIKGINIRITIERDPEVESKYQPKAFIYELYIEGVAVDTSNDLRDIWFDIGEQLEEKKGEFPE